MSNVTHIVPDDAQLFDVARQAAAQGVILISNGDRFALASTIPPGWHAMPVGDKSGQICRAAGFRTDLGNLPKHMGKAPATP